MVAKLNGPLPSVWLDVFGLPSCTWALPVRPETVPPTVRGWAVQATVTLPTSAVAVPLPLATVQV